MAFEHNVRNDTFHMFVIDTQKQFTTWFQNCMYVIDNHIKEVSHVCTHLEKQAHWCGRKSGSFRLCNLMIHLRRIHENKVRGRLTLKGFQQISLFHVNQIFESV